MIGCSSRHDDGARDPPRGALLAEIVENVGESLLGRRIDEIGRARACSAHAHIERPVVAEGKAAFGLVELHRGNADVEDDSCEWEKILAGGDLLEFRETRLREPEPALGLLDEVGAATDCGRVAVQCEDVRARGREQGAAVAARAEGRIEVSALGAGAQSGDRLGEQHGNMSVEGGARWRHDPSLGRPPPKRPSFAMRIRSRM